MPLHLVGLIVRCPIFNQPRHHNIFDDAPWWETPADFDEPTPSRPGGIFKPERLLNEYETSRM